jgi:hypothetical protein
MERNEAAAGLERGARGEECRTGHPSASRYDKQVSVIALVRVVCARGEQRAEVFRRDEFEHGYKGTKSCFQLRLKLVIFAMEKIHFSHGASVEKQDSERK